MAARSASEAARAGPERKRHAMRKAAAARMASSGSSDEFTRNSAPGCENLHADDSLPGDRRPLLFSARSRSAHAARRDTAKARDRLSPLAGREFRPSAEA